MPGGDNTSAGELRKLSAPAVLAGLFPPPQLRNRVLALEATRENSEKHLLGHRCSFRGSQPSSLGVMADIY